MNLKTVIGDATTLNYTYDRETIYAHFNGGTHPTTVMLSLEEAEEVVAKTSPEKSIQLREAIALAKALSPSWMN